MTKTIMRPRPILAALLLLVAAAAASAACLPENTAQDRASAQDIAGHWKEYWGTPGQTDVTYNDEYMISVSDEGKVGVEVLERDNQRIDNVRYENGLLSFTQHTSFAVQYKLRLQPDRKWLVGEAETPRGKYPIRWEKLSGEPETPETTPPGPAVSAGDEIVGRWKEYWGTPGQTDVTYNDEYLISRDDNGRLAVAILERNQRIEDVRYEDRLLSFTQYTSFKIKYKLRLQQDGNWLVGTAETPNLTEKIKWERID